MNRRELLLVAGSSIALTLAGCSGGDSDDQDPDTPTSTPDAEPGDGNEDGTGDDDTGDGTTDDDTGDGTTDDDTGDGTTDGRPPTNAELPGDPIGTVDAYVDALDRSDEEAALALLHEEALQDETDVARDVEFFGDADVTLEERAIVSVEEETVVVQGIVRLDRADSEEVTRIALELSLRQGPEGEWLIYDGRGQRLESGGE